jgi:hypothetical protein
MNCGKHLTNQFLEINENHKHSILESDIDEANNKLDELVMNLE